MITVAIAHRPGPAQTALHDAALPWWRRNGFDPVIVDSPGRRWNAAAARNRAVLEHGEPGRLMMVVDYGVRPMNPGPLSSALAAAVEQPDRLHIGFADTQVCRIGTNAPVRRVWEHPAGILIVDPAVWWKAGGQDERFGSDWEACIAFTIAHETLLKVSPVWALGTAVDFRTDRRAPLRESVLLGEYREKHSRIQKMRALLVGANGGQA